MKTWGVLSSGLRWPISIAQVPNQDLAKEFLERYALSEEGLTAMYHAKPIGLPALISLYEKMAKDNPLFEISTMKRTCVAVSSKPICARTAQIDLGEHAGDRTELSSLAPREGEKAKVPLESAQHKRVPRRELGLVKAPSDLN
jgi:hypothetical protein